MRGTIYDRRGRPLAETGLEGESKKGYITEGKQ